ncbi:peptidase U35 [Azospirillum sp. B510]|uniref:prohead protease/major capsid protein fusion protein n=1 Tax=Azospirillum sp. (strain B510) TaxID=137722 RepID=UPI0001C4BEFE|nr:prohead protease/major capsid protein fusion protein [Azospirillum sp. B510]BAI72847.1 peptidase U35 [Azospirillum sp. B510]
MSDIFVRAAAFVPGTLNRDARTVEVTAISGPAPVTRTGRAPDGTMRRWIEQLDATAVDWGAFAGAPVLKDHNPTTDSTVGVIESARLEGKAASAVVRFSEKPAAQELLSDIEAGIIRGVSLGYRVSKFSREGDVFTAVQWKPLELSFVPLPADAGATVRSEEFMAEITTETETTRTDGPVLNRAQRNAEIRSIARVSGLPQTWVDAQIDGDAELDAVRAAAFSEMQKRSGPALNTAQIQVIQDHGDPIQVRTAMADALAARLAPAHVKPEGRAREFTSWTVVDMAGELARARGATFDHRNRAAVVEALFSRAAHSTSDFPLLLQDATNKALLPSYNSAAPTYRQWSAARSFNDFRPHRFLRLGDFPGLKEIGAEGGEPEYGTLSENRETVSPKEFGTGVSIDRRALLNDDLGALASLTGLIGVRVAAEENRLAYDHLLSNPVLSDGHGVFHATHENLMPSAGITVESVAAVVATMRKQKSRDGVPLNIAPRFLLIGPDSELAARRLLAAITAAQVGNVNPWSGLLELIVDANIADDRWIVFADPGMYPTFVHGYVAGTTGPTVRSEIDFDTRALKIAVGLDFGYGAIDFRGAAFNPG